MKLFVGGISNDIDEVDLKEMFELYGEVNFAQVIKDRETGKSKGFGFVEMPNVQEAKEAMELLDGKALFGKKIAVKEAGEPPRQARPSTDNRWGNNGPSNRPPRRRF
ncbi:MAG: RNA recognition motif domain-containing protein [Chitinophagaceae bacterium]